VVNTFGLENGEAFGVRLSFLALWIGDNSARAGYRSTP